MSTTYKKYQAAGRCTQCGGETQGKSRCEWCRKAHSLHDHNRREARRAAGLCTTCGKVNPSEGYHTCWSCRIRSAAACRMHYAKKKQEGVT